MPATQPAALAPSPLTPPSSTPQAALDLRPVPAELLPLVPLFCRSLTNMGTEKESFVELTERIGRKTGGLSIYPFTSNVRGQAEPLAYIMLRGKVGAGLVWAVLVCAHPCWAERRWDELRAGSTRGGGRTFAVGSLVTCVCGSCCKWRHY